MFALISHVQGYTTPIILDYYPVLRLGNLLVKRHIYLQQKMIQANCHAVK